ncbi:NAD(P)-dependent oxidoreductase [uncultured Arcticibacterium sp.]|uniref:NAD-dependent epimerase/dehydratase family protein n=1 Tax=uncultured Arcticibacterium sp. TaxID=2173042 RepID=UPI0030F890A0
MTLGIIGGSGFIGNDFLERYGDSFSSIRFLSRKSRVGLKSNVVQVIGSLDLYESIEELTLGCDVLVHAGFDHMYSYNVTGIKNVLKACNANNVKTLVYLSSYIVYDLKTEGSPVSETSDMSGYGDIYTKEKQRIEKILKTDRSSLLKLVLQPSIVYGLKGNWSKTFMSLLNSPNLIIPKKGKGTLAAVYVADVAQAIFKAAGSKEVESKNKYQPILISNGTPYLWEDLYKMHGILQKRKFICSASNQNLFAESTIKNLVIKILYSSIGGFLMRPLLKVLKKKMESSKSKAEQGSNELSLNGIYRALHFGTPEVNINKAKAVLAFEPKYGLEEALEEMNCK